MKTSGYFQPAMMLLTGALLATGCSNEPSRNYSSVELVKVVGRITLDDEPLSEAVVVFEDMTNGTMSSAMTNTNGDYALRFDSEAIGVTPGTKRVQISTTRKILGLNTSVTDSDFDSDPADVSPVAERVPECYHRKSALIADVNPSTRVFNFDLKANCSTKGPTLD